ncbi:MAG: ATP-binding protein [Niabella sp.]
MSTLQRTQTWLIGDPDNHNLESRIFNSICIITFLISLFNIAYNFVVGIYTTSIIFIVVLFLISYLYYLSRVKKQLGYTFSAFIVLIAIAFCFNYIYCDGVQGATLLSFAVLFFLVFIVVRQNKYPYWLAFMLIMVWGLLMYEYYFPENIRHAYANLQAQIIDLGTTVTVIFITFYICIRYLKNAYENEKNIAEKQALALKILNDEKTKLFSVISHDLNSPLRNIANYLEELKSSNLSDKEKQTVETELAKTVTHTQEMLNNLLAWSGSQLHNYQTKLSENNIASLIESVIDTFEIEVSRKEINLEKNINPHAVAHTDANMVKVISRNLIGNAIKFTPPKGKVTITVTETENAVQLCVKDSGMGIADNQKEKIFTLNVGSTYGTSNEKGVGLGLYLCKEYIIAQNGRIWFESKKGEGASFFVSFPKMELAHIQQPLPQKA